MELTALALAFLILVVSLVTLARARRLRRVLRAVIEKGGQPLLVYDDHRRLVFHSGGLIVFDRSALEAIRRLEVTPDLGKTIVEERVIDGNRYRARIERFEFAPDRHGTVVYLDYQGPTTA